MVAFSTYSTFCRQIELSKTGARYKPLRLSLPKLTVVNFHAAYINVLKQKYH